MISINTNLSSLIVQNNLKSATSGLNQAIERMTTGFKINGAKDNAANHSISTNISTKLSSYDIAMENATMGMDLITTAEENLSLVNNHLQRIRDLAEQASNGTYSAESLQAIQSEVNARQDEINRIIANTEYNGIKLFEGGSTGGVTGAFINDVVQLTEEEALAQGYTIIRDRAGLEAMTVNNTSVKYILMNDIDLSGADWTAIENFQGELNGNGFVVRNISGDSFLGSIENAKILNLGLENVDIKNIEETGGFVRYANSGSEITNCYTKGSISDVAGAGGFVMSNSGTISACYSEMNVAAFNQAGGFVASNTGSIENSYSSGTVSGGDWGEGGFISKDTSVLNDCYYNSENSGLTDSNGGSQGVTTAELNSLIASGAFRTTPALSSASEIILQVGINADSSSQITLETSFGFNLSVNVLNNDSARSSLSKIDEVLASVSAKRTEYGAALNHLESAIESISITSENLISSLSTIRDADIAEESSQYIKMQILQQASATLLATANQTPSIALQLI